MLQIYEQSQLKFKKTSYKDIYVYQNILQQLHYSKRLFFLKNYYKNIITLTNKLNFIILHKFYSIGFKF